MAKAVEKILSQDQAALFAQELRSTEEPINRYFDNIIIIDTGALICVSRSGASAAREVYDSRQKFFKAYGV